VYWEPSPRDVVREMVRMAEVRKADVVYDLGCGDGRVVIEAAKQGARGVGIDLDPRRIKESVDNAAAAGVVDQVHFSEGNLFQADVHDATVVMLFLFPDVNLRLRPKLIRELTPSTKVLSYCHSMDAWEPDRYLKIRTNYLYYWMVPANIGGHWAGQIDRSGSSIPLRLELEQEFQQVRGRVMIGDALWRIESASMRGRDFNFMARGGPRGDRLSLNGTAADDLASGTLESQGYFQGTAGWTATRIPDTRRSLAR